MALVAHVDGGAFGVARCLPRRDEGVDAGGRAAAGEEPARALRIADPAPEPVDDDQLQLARAARDKPGALVDVVAGAHEVGHHAGPGGRRRNEPEGAGVIVTQRERQNLAREPSRSPPRPAVPSSGGSSSSWSSRTCRNSPSQAFSPGRPSIRPTTMLERLLPELEHLLARHLETAGHLGCPTVPPAFPRQAGGCSLGFRPVDPSQSSPENSFSEFRLLSYSYYAMETAQKPGTDRRVHAATSRTESGTYLETALGWR